MADAAKIPHSNNHNHALCKETPFMWFMVIVSNKLTHKLNILSEIVLTKLIFIPVKPSSVDLLDLSFDFFFITAGIGNVEGNTFFNFVKSHTIIISLKLDSIQL